MTTNFVDSGTLESMLDALNTLRAATGKGSLLFTLNIGSGVSGFPSGANAARLAVIGQQRGTGVAAIGITETSKLWVLFANPYSGRDLASLWKLIGQDSIGTLVDLDSDY